AFNFRRASIGTYPTRSKRRLARVLLVFVTHSSIRYYFTPDPVDDGLWISDCDFSRSASGYQLA
ncbi:MAG: hypothetical protein ACKN9V_09715, partial [Pseudomonadota bacterium]